MQKAELVSIIVPVYKVEPFLRRCLDSAVGQSYENVEVIVVDDGSPDGCPAICDEYAARDPRVRVIHQANQGLSAARNAGLEAARGEWLYFMDSDDWCETDIVGRCVEKAADTGADLVIFDHRREGDVKQGLIEVGMPEGAHSAYDALVALYEDRIDFGVWHFVFRKSLFDGIRFPEGRICEDVAIMFRLFEAARSVYVLHEVGYHYVYNRPGGITDTNDMNGWEFEHTLLMLEHAKRERPELVAAAEARAVRRAALHSVLLAGYGTLDDLRKLRDTVRSAGLSPRSLPPMGRLGWHLFMHATALYKLERVVFGGIKYRRMLRQQKAAKA